MSTQETTAQVHHVPDKLRIGLLVDDDTVPYWVRLIIERLNASSSADIVLVAKHSLGGAARQYAAQDPAQC